MVGSSSSRMSGPCTKASTIARRFCQPPDNAVASASRSSKPARPSNSAKRLPRSFLGTCACSRAVSITDLTVAPTRKLRLLLNIAQARALPLRHFAAVGVHDPSENPHHRGLARAVRADQSDAIPFGNGERHFLKERVRSEGLRDSLCINDGWQRLASPQVLLLRLSGKQDYACPAGTG